MPVETVATVAYGRRGYRVTDYYRAEEVVLRRLTVYAEHTKGPDMVCDIDESTREWIKANFQLFESHEGEFYGSPPGPDCYLIVRDKFLTVHLVVSANALRTFGGKITVEKLRGTCEMFGIELPDPYITNEVDRAEEWLNEHMVLRRDTGHVREWAMVMAGRSLRVRRIEHFGQHELSAKMFDGIGYINGPEFPKVVVNLEEIKGMYGELMKSAEHVG